MDELRFIKYSSIGQFRNVVREVARDCMYSYDPELDDYTYIETNKQPTLTFTGTVKVHGTNAGIYCTQKNNRLEINAQKRSSSVGVNGGHFGFADWVYSGQGQALASWVLDHYLDTIQGDDYVIYGEWCGGNIQKGLAISGLPKMFIVFGIEVIRSENAECVELQESMINHPEFEGVYDVRQFGMYSINIDFENPKLSVNTMVGLT